MLISALALTAGLAAAAEAQDLRLLMPEGMIASGFDKQILPRFKFKHRIAVQAVAKGDSDMSFGAAGTRVFQEIDGDPIRLEIVTEDPAKQAQASVFLDWLQSVPGKAAIEAFEPGGAQVYTTTLARTEVAAPQSFDGDAAEGGRLALVHCGRCHVVDSRNRMGGIGSTPSFAALRGRQNWADLFRAFWSQNPHPSFTQVAGVTDPFDPGQAIHVAPVEITPAEIEAIVAFVAKIEPKELGRAVQSN